jgi:hypothetical protein
MSTEVKFISLQDGINKFGSIKTDIIVLGNRPYIQICAATTHTVMASERLTQHNNLTI